MSPIYVYDCPKCKKQEEIMRSVQYATEQVRCRNCGDMMDKVLVHTGARIKGGTPKFHQRSPGK